MTTSLRIVVTGAGRGIGRSICMKLLAQGHKVALCARTGSELDSIAADHPESSLVLVGDLLMDDTPQSIIQSTIQKWGGVDVLILNAGDGLSVSLEKTTDEMWNHMLDLNLSAPFKLMRSVIPTMKSQGGGNIIVIASKAGLVGQAYVAAYTAAKHGVVGLVRAAATELDKFGITVNAVCPDFVDTPLTSRSIEVAAERSGKDIEVVLDALKNKLNGNRLLTPDEVADAAILFIGDKNSNGVTSLLEGK